jgi:hypothetical protein
LFGQPIYVRETPDNQGWSPDSADRRGIAVGGDPQRPLFFRLR